MAFHDLDYVSGILTSAGFTGVEASEVELNLTPPGTAGDIADFVCRVGPATRIIDERKGTPEDVAAIKRDVLAALSEYETTEGVRVPAVLTLFHARKP